MVAAATAVKAQMIQGEETHGVSVQMACIRMLHQRGSESSHCARQWLWLCSAGTIMLSGMFCGSVRSEFIKSTGNSI